MLAEETVKEFTGGLATQMSLGMVILSLQPVLVVVTIFIL
jgi:hypothetical protein